MKAKLFAVVLSLSFLSNYCLATNIPDKNSLQPPSQSVNKKINLNTASITELTNSFKGIGEKRAQNIINYRTEHGKFKDITELAKVKGIGQKFIERNLDGLKKTFSLG